MSRSSHRPIPSSKTQPQSADKDITDFNRVNHLAVTQHQHDQRLDNFLLARLKGLPRSHVYKMIRCDEIRINNKRCKAHHKLHKGDVVRIAPVKLATRDKPIISDEFADTLLQSIVYEDDGLFILNKPSGMAVHGGSGLNFGVIEAMRKITQKSYLELVHRIDKDTSGLLMIAKKRSVLKQLQQHLRDKTIDKHYLCVVDGKPILDDFWVQSPLLRYTTTNGERRVRVDDKHHDAKASQTHCSVISRWQVDDRPLALIQASPQTGRTHQIRVHLASVSCPILGDDKYHVNWIKDDLDVMAFKNVKRLCLHAWKLKIPGYPQIVAKVPKDMTAIIGDNMPI